MRKTLFLFVLGATAGMTGCALAPEQCDPRIPDASLVTKAQCLYGGEYERRQQLKQAVLDDELRLNAMFRETLEVIDAEHIRVRERAAASTLELAHVSRSVEKLLQEVSLKASEDEALTRQIRVLQQDIDQLEKQPGVSPLQQRQALSDLAIKVSDLQKTMQLR